MTWKVPDTPGERRAHHPPQALGPPARAVLRRPSRRRALTPAVCAARHLRDGVAMGASGGCAPGPSPAARQPIRSTGCSARLGSCFSRCSGLSQLTARRSPACRHLASAFDLGETRCGRMHSTAGGVRRAGSCFSLRRRLLLLARRGPGADARFQNGIGSTGGLAPTSPCAATRWPPAGRLGWQSVTARAG